MRNLPQHQPRRHVGTVRGFHSTIRYVAGSLVYERSPGLQTGEALLPKPKRLFSFLILFILVVSSLLTFFPKLVSPAQAQNPRPLKYFGADVVEASDIATLASLNMNTATVVLSAYGGEGAWAPYLNAAKQHRVGLVIWPTGGGGNCGFPYNGTDISAIYPMLDYFGDEEMFYGIVNAHEPSWSCPMSVPDMISIRQQIKDYVRNKYGREIKVWNYIDNITSFVTSGEIMDIALTWDYCFALPGYSCEKPCATTQQIIVNDRNTIDSSGWNHVDLVHLFHTFELTGYNGCRMPTEDELYQWSCSFLNTNALDGLLYYTWQNPAGYTQTLADRPDLWPAVQRVYNNCVNKDGVSTPTPTPTTGSSPTPTSTPAPKDPDLDGDGQVNAQDMKQLLAAWGLIVSTADEDLDSNGKVNSLDAGRIIANWTGGPPASPTPSPTPPPNATPTPTPTPGSPPTGDMIYGARYASADSYWELASLGVMHPNSIVYSSGFESQVDNIVSTAQAVKNTYPNFKPSLFMWDQSTGDWSVTCGGISSAGNAFIQYLNSQNYWDDIYAINGLHEPLGRYCCSSVAQIQGVVAQIKSLSNGQAMIFEKIFSDVSEYECGLSFTDGICDYCAVLYHPYPYQGSFQSTTLSNNVKRHIDMVKGVPSGTTLNKFTPWLAAIYFPEYLYMPSPTELYNGGNIILSAVSPEGRQVDGLIWYTWDNVNQWTGLNQYNVDGQRAGRMDVIRDVGRLR